MSEQQILITVQLRFPTVDRRVIADQVAPLVREAIAAGGELGSISVQTIDLDDDDRGE